jgi:hypothetical protein
VEPHVLLAVVGALLVVAEGELQLVALQAVVVQTVVVTPLVEERMEGVMMGVAVIVMTAPMIVIQNLHLIYAPQPEEQTPVV